jgi:hypothetical protein
MVQKLMISILIFLSTGYHREKKRCSVSILFSKMPCGDLNGSVSIPPNTLQLLLEVFRSAQHNSIISDRKTKA